MFCRMENKVFEFLVKQRRVFSATVSYTLVILLCLYWQPVRISFQMLTGQKATPDHAASLLEKYFSQPGLGKESLVLLVDEVSGYYYSGQIPSKNLLYFLNIGVVYGMNPFDQVKLLISFRRYFYFKNQLLFFPITLFPMTFWFYYQALRIFLP